VTGREGGETNVEPVAGVDCHGKTIDGPLEHLWGVRTVQKLQVQQGELGARRDHEELVPM